MYPLAEFIHQVRSRAIRVVEEMERQGKVAASTFKPLEQLRVPEDFDSLASTMLDDSVRATAARLKAVTDDIVRKRNWSWCLMHPELDEHVMHPSRSMFSSTASVMAWIEKGVRWMMVR